jgi:AraC-like DNA-binding protein
MELANTLKQFSASTGIPLAAYTGDDVIAEYGTFTPNPALAIMDGLGISDDGIYYTISPDYLFCGYMRDGERVAVLGPVLYYRCTKKLARNILRMIEQNQERELELMRWFRSMPTCNIERFQQALSFLRMLLKSSVSDTPVFVPYLAPMALEKTLPQVFPIINTQGLELERRVLKAVESGDVGDMEAILYTLNTDAIDFGYLAEDAIRSFKNTFIMSIALISRAAIKGGVDYDTAIWLSDDYLLQIESLNSYPEILNFIRQMFMDFTRRVAKLRQLPSDSPVVTRISRYIHTHMHEKVRLPDIAVQLGMNSSYLSRHFREKTGMTIKQYTTKMKIDEAKRLLEYTDLSLSGICAHVGFSDQHYLHTVFKKQTGTTPTVYRHDIRG